MEERFSVPLLSKKLLSRIYSHLEYRAVAGSPFFVINKLVTRYSLTNIMFIYLILIAGLYESEEENSYNAFEKDIAVVHFFFQVRQTSPLEFMHKLSSLIKGIQL
jgi:hypothetical protein